MTKTYDERTCITAGELRSMGFPIPDSVPDCAWVERGSFDIVPGGTAIDGDTITMEMSISFNQPFNWVEASFFVSPKGDAP